MDDEAGRWLTYAEAAAALHTTSEAVRQQARRGQWPKQIPNQRGQPARIQVPPALLQEAASAVPAVPPADPELVPALRAHVADLQAAMAAATGREEDYRRQIVFLQGQLERLQAEMAERPQVGEQGWKLAQLIRRWRQRR